MKGTEAPSGAPEDAPRYNEVFERLVLRDDDLVGMIAYALYKQHKREWLLEFEARKGRHPTPDEVKLFVDSQTGSQLSRLKQTAEAVLSEYSETIVEIETPSIQRKALETELANGAKATLKAVEDHSRWYKQIGAGVASAMVWSMILLAVLLALASQGVDVLSASEKVHSAFGNGSPTRQP